MHSKVIPMPLRVKILKVSTDGVPGNILYANDTFLKLHKVTLEDVVGAQMQKLLCSDLPAEYYSLEVKKIKTGEVWHGILPTTASDGTAVWSRGTIYPAYNYKGEITEYRYEGIVCSKEEMARYRKILIDKYERGEI